MLVLGLLFFTMLLLAGTVVFSVVKAQHTTVTTSPFLLLMIGVIFSAAFLYQILGDRAGVQQWMNAGEKHYQLLQTFDALGGIDGAISGIRKKLLIDPEDAKGWFILGKLYLAKGEVVLAKQAFQKAHSLMPSDQEIEAYAVKK